MRKETREVHETFTEKEIKAYAKAWGCGRKEAVRRLEELVVC
jgi:hypothetical protein